MKNIFFAKLFVFIALSVLYSCKKDLSTVDPPVRPDVERTAEQQVLDSVYSKYKYLSYWESSIPSYNPISDLTDDFSNAKSLLSYLKNQTPVFNNFFNYPDRKGPIDSYSWIEDMGDDTDYSAKADLADGYGLFMAFDGDRNDSLFVMFVEGGSPAAKVGIKRGDKVMELQGDKNMVYSNQSKINQYVEERTLSIKIKSNNIEKSHNLTYTSYNIEPFQLGKVIVEKGTKTGYIALSSFEELYSSGADNKMRKGIDSIFTVFATENISDLIVDLRYNGGGYVSSAIYLLNKIINSTGNGKLMFKYGVNKNLEKERNEGSRDFVDEVFDKSGGTTEIKKVVFLASEYTASASEIVIVALKPYMDVKIVAYRGATYGKPVGFFREDISDDIGLWAASFKIINADNYTDYWDGIPADYPNTYDNIHKQFGDPSEDMTRKALDILNTNSSMKASTRETLRSSASGNIKELNRIPPRNMLKK